MVKLNIAYKSMYVWIFITYGTFVILYGLFPKAYPPLEWGGFILALGISLYVRWRKELDGKG